MTEWHQNLILWHTNFMTKKPTQKYVCPSISKKRIIWNWLINNHFCLSIREKEEFTCLRNYAMKPVFQTISQKISLKCEQFKIIKSHQPNKGWIKAISSLQSCLIIRSSKNGLFYLIKIWWRLKVLINLHHQSLIKDRTVHLNSQNMLILKSSILNH